MTAQLVSPTARPPFRAPARVAEMLERETIRSDSTVDLGLFSVRILSNVESFPGVHYFSTVEETSPDSRAPEYTLVCIDQSMDDLPRPGVERLRDSTYRAARFASGYYLAHHFGPPITLISEGGSFVIVGRELHRTVWPYFVKHWLTRYSVQHGLLHLKAAGIVHSGSRATLLVGKGSAGKTVFLSQACLHGAGFLANTHVLMDGVTAHGVPSVLRVRHDAVFGPLIDERRLPAHLERGEYRADPRALFPTVVGAAPAVNLCIIDFKPGRHEIRELDRDRFYDFMESFSLAVPTYGLKDDLLADVADDVESYTTVYADMKRRMRALVESCSLLYASVDMLDPPARERTLRTLESAGRCDT